MKSEYKIIDNALDVESFNNLQAWISSNAFPWFHHGQVAYDEDEELSQDEDEEYLNLRKLALTKSQKEYNFALVHMIYNDGKMWCGQETWDMLSPLLRLTKVEELIRAKVNYYPKTSEIVHHKDHTDWRFEHKGALFYLNDCDGLTVLEDGTEVESIANRLLLFDSSKPHHSTTTTNADRRLNINVNYF